MNVIDRRLSPSGLRRSSCFMLSVKTVPAISSGENVKRTVNESAAMKISIACVGKLKEKYLADAVREYSKRLTRYCRPEILEVTDESIPEKASEAEETALRAKEGERLLKIIPENSWVVTCEIAGKTPDSIEFAGLLRKWMNEGKSHFTFVIGGSTGLSEDILRRSDFRLSFSRMTFPHQLMRVILLEQIYRAFRINAGEPYHK